MISRNLDRTRSGVPPKFRDALTSLPVNTLSELDPMWCINRIHCGRCLVINAIYDVGDAVGMEIKVCSQGKNLNSLVTEFSVTLLKTYLAQDISCSRHI